MTDVERACTDKARAVRLVGSRYDIGPAEMCFMGDDVNDITAMDICGFAAAPADARQVVRDQADLVTKDCGGNGAVRELIDFLLASTHCSLNRSRYAHQSALSEPESAIAARKLGQLKSFLG